MTFEVLQSRNVVATQVEMNDILQIQRRKRFQLVKGKVECLQIWEDTCVGEKSAIFDDVSTQVQRDYEPQFLQMDGLGDLVAIELDVP